MGVCPLGGLDLFLQKSESQSSKKVGKGRKYKIQKDWQKKRESERDRERHTHRDMAGILLKEFFTMRCLWRLYAALTEDQDAGEAQGLG